MLYTCHSVDTVITTFLPRLPFEVLRVHFILGYEVISQCSWWGLSLVMVFKALIHVQTFIWIRWCIHDAWCTNGLTDCLSCLHVKHTIEEKHREINSICDSRSRRITSTQDKRRSPPLDLGEWSRTETGHPGSGVDAWNRMLQSCNIMKSMLSYCSRCILKPEILIECM